MAAKKTARKKVAKKAVKRTSTSRKAVRKTVSKPTARKTTKKTNQKKAKVAPVARPSIPKKESKGIASIFSASWHRILLLIALVVAVILLFVLLYPAETPMDEERGPHPGQIAAESTVTIEYTGSFEDGTVFDSTDGKEPLTFTIGDGQVISGFEQAIMGLYEGDSTTIHIDKDSAYGDRDPENIAEYPRERVPEDYPVQEGSVLFLQNGEGQQTFATVKEIKEEVLILDLNHPLSGHDLSFEITIVSVDNPEVAQTI